MLGWLETSERLLTLSYIIYAPMSLDSNNKRLDELFASAARHLSAPGPSQSLGTKVKLEVMFAFTVVAEPEMGEDLWTLQSCDERATASELTSFDL